jgi:hypothetical protein
MPILFNIKKYHIHSKNGRDKDTKYVQHIPPENEKTILKLPRAKLLAIVLNMNKMILKLCNDYNKVFKLLEQIQGEPIITKPELGEFINELFTPSQGNENGCSTFEYEVRKKYYKQDKTECPFMNCRYWFNNKEWSNCSKIVASQANDEHGWSLEKISEIKNLLSKGNLSKERIRQIEVIAINKLIKKEQNNPEIQNLLIALLQWKENEDERLCNQDSTELPEE